MLERSGVPEAVELLYRLAEQIASLEREVEGYRRALVAHHEFSTLSDEVLREYDFRECPVCARARCEREMAVPCQEPERSALVDGGPSRSGSGSA